MIKCIFAEDEVEVQVYICEDKYAAMLLWDGTIGRNFDCYMTKEQCQQLIEQLMLVCERLQE